MRLQSYALCALALLSGSVTGHPGHDLSQEIAERRSFLNTVQHRSLAHCRDKFAASGLQVRTSSRRTAFLDEARKKRGLSSKFEKRDADDVLGKSHNKTELGYTPVTDPDTLFAGVNSCLLTPEVTQGPYYVGGENVRRNVVENQAGVETILEYQVVNIDTCEPIPNVYLEIWHCNSTGVYSGVNAAGNGDNSDESNIDSTFLRGIQPTDSDGVAQFESTFPGHYTGRATHIHVMVHTNATLYPNQTLGNEIYASHVGQAFFDQNLISSVELSEPYISNTQELTLNSDDSILAEEAATDGVDPMMEYTLLGDSVSDGLFAWLAFGINTTYSDKIEPAVFHYAEGGVENPDAGGPGGSMPPPGNSSPLPTGN